MLISSYTNYLWTYNLWLNNNAILHFSSVHFALVFLICAQFFLRRVTVSVLIVCDKLFTHYDTRQSYLAFLLSQHIHIYVFIMAMRYDTYNSYNYLCKKQNVLYSRSAVMFLYTTLILTVIRKNFLYSVFVNLQNFITERVKNNSNRREIRSGSDRQTFIY